MIHIVASILMGAAIVALLAIRHRRIQDSRVLQDFHRRVLGSLDLAEVARVIAGEAGLLVGASGVGIAFVGGDPDALDVSHVNTGPFRPVIGGKLPLKGSFAGWCARTGQSLLVNHASRDSRGHAATLAAGAVAHILVAPLTIAGHVFGTIAAGRTEPHAPFRRRDLRLWNHVAQFVSLAWSNAQLHGRANAQRRRTEELQAWNASLIGVFDRRRVMNAMVEHAAHALQGDAASLTFVDGDDVVYEARSGPGPFTPGFRTPADQSLAGVVIRGRRPLRVTDLARDPRFPRHPQETQVRAVLAVPLVLDGAAVASLAVLQHTARSFTDDDEDHLHLIADLSARLLRTADAFVELKQARQQVVDLFHMLPDGAVLIDRAGWIAVGNVTAGRLLGVRSEELAGRSLADVALDWPELQAWCFANDGRPRAGQLRCVDGAIREVEWRASRAPDPDQVIVTVRDRTDEHRRTSEMQTLAAAVHAMQDGVILLDHDGVIQFVNDSAAYMYGYERPRELIGQSVDAVLPPDGLAAFVHRLPVMRTDGWSGELQGQRHGGKVFPIELAVAPVPLGSRDVGLVCVAKDLTERRAIEQRASASDKLATLGRLVAGAAHEINNPLAAILSNAELLRVGRPVEAGLGESLDVIIEECRRAGRIVRDLLSFSRQSPVARSPVDLGALAGDVLALRTRYLEASGVAVRFEAPEALFVHADAQQLKQVLLNLLINAEQAMQGSPARRLVLRVQRDVASVLVVIDDSGPGVPEALRQRIFEPFFTTKAEGQGTGLGLSVSYGIVLEHGGTLSVEPSPLNGARFIVRLPASVGPEATATSEPHVEPVAPAKGVCRRVLVVDDEASIRNAVSRILRAFNHDVATAADGAEALALARATRFDMIICDLRMPGMSGVELHAELTREGLLEDTAFAVATGDIADGTATEFVRATGAPVLLKPFELSRLVALVGDAA